MKTRVDQAIAAFRWICGDEGTSPGADELLKQSVLGDGTDASEELVIKLLPYVTEIKNERDIRAFLASVVVRDGLLLEFSPRWTFDTYVKAYTDGSDVYDEEQAEMNDDLLRRCFFILEQQSRQGEIYSLTSELMFAVHMIEL